MRKRLLITLFLSPFFIFAQEIEERIEVMDSLVNETKRISIGIKIGVPNIAGLSLEGISPLLDNRIAPYFDYSSFNINPDDTEVELSYSEFGSNVYFGNQGNGVYAAIGFGTLSTDLKFKNVTLEKDGNSGTGQGFITQKLNTTNIKLGIKTEGRIYFRLEIGYGFGDIPEEIEVSGTFKYQDDNGQTITSTGTKIETFPTIPGVGTSGVLIGNFGFGVSF